MAIYPGARSVIQSGAALGTSQKYADASARKAQDVRRSRESAATAKERVGAVEQTIESSGLRGDDGIPPGYPTVTAESFFHQVDLYWPRPPASDEVAGSLVRIRPEDESSRIVSRPSHSATIKNLPHKPHTFEVLLFDKWGRESLWSDPVTATPMLTAAEEIDLSEIAMLGRLRGLLPDTNLATITDATKLADELVSSGKIAPGAVTGPKLPDGVINGPKLAASAVEADKIAANAVTAPKILSDQIQTRHITAGAVTASVMAAQDAAAFNLWAQNAMIRSAAIQSVKADQITAGTITAGQITLAGAGSLKAGQTMLDASGMTLAPLSDFGYTDRDRDYKITSTSGKQALYWVTKPTSAPAGGVNAAVLQGEAGEFIRGMAYLAGIQQPDDFAHRGNATVRAMSYRPQDDAASYVEARAAVVDIDSRDRATVYASGSGSWAIIGARVSESADIVGPLSGSVECYSDVARVGGGLVQINGKCEVDEFQADRLIPAYDGAVGSAPAGGWVQWTHGLGRIPHLALGWLHMGNGQLRPLTNSGGTSVGFVDATRIRLLNDTGSSQNMSCTVY